jgi:hypothetical protein
VFRSETPIPVSIPSGGTLAVNLVMQNREAGEYEQPATFYLEVDGQLIEKSVSLKGQVVLSSELKPVAAKQNDNSNTEENSP